MSETGIFVWNIFVLVYSHLSLVPVFFAVFRGSYLLLYGLGSIIESLASPCHKAALYQKQQEQKMSSLRQLSVLWELLFLTSVDVEHLGKGKIKAQ